jgi:hypothetical protein
MEAGMSVTNADGRYYTEEGTALVISAGSQIVIIAARHERLISCECRNNYNLWKRFFRSFTVRNAAVPVKKGEDPSQLIIGYWKTAENMVISDYLFAANGKFQHAGAFGNTSTSSDFNYDYIHYKSWSWEGDGSYSINGNHLTLKKRGSSPEELQVRFEKINHGGTGWKDRMYIIRKDNYSENEAGYEKQTK